MLRRRRSLADWGTPADKAGNGGYPARGVSVAAGVVAALKRIRSSGRNPAVPVRSISRHSNAQSERVFGL